MFKRLSILGIVLFAFAFARMTASAETIMNGKEVTPYFGRIVMHNERTHKIEVKTEENSTGTWKVSGRVVVMHKGDRLDLSGIWGKTKRVKVWVTKSGVVERIDVLEWKE